MPILVLLRSNWKFISIVSAIMAIFYAGYHYRGSVDQIAADKFLADQIKANKDAQDELNAKSAKLETELAKERIKSSDLQARWSKLNAEKHTICILPTNHIQLLKDATSNTDQNSQ